MFMENEQDRGGSDRREISEHPLAREYRFTKSEYVRRFLSGHFLERQLGKTPEEVTKLRHAFPEWKEAQYLFLPRLVRTPAEYTIRKDIIDDLDFPDLATAAFVALRSCQNQVPEAEQPSEKISRRRARRVRWAQIYCIANQAMLEEKKETLVPEEMSTLADEFIRSSAKTEFQKEDATDTAARVESEVLRNFWVVSRTIEEQEKEDNKKSKQAKLLAHFVRTNFPEGEQITPVEGSDRMRENFPKHKEHLLYITGRMRLAKWSETVESMDYGALIEFAQDKINNNIRNRQPIMYWSQIRTFALIAQLQDNQGTTDY